MNIKLLLTISVMTEHGAIYISKNNLTRVNTPALLRHKARANFRKYPKSAICLMTLAAAGLITHTHYKPASKQVLSSTTQESLPMPTVHIEPVPTVHTDLSNISTNRRDIEDTQASLSVPTVHIVLKNTANSGTSPIRHRTSYTNSCTQSSPLPQISHEIQASLTSLSSPHTVAYQQLELERKSAYQELEVDQIIEHNKIKHLERSMHQSTETDAEIAKLTATATQAQLQVQTLGRELQESRAASAALEDELTQVTQELQESRAASAALEDELTQVTQELATANNTINNQQKEIEDLKNHIQGLEGELEQLKNLYAKSLEELEQAHHKQDEAHKAFQKHQAELSEALEAIENNSRQQLIELEDAYRQAIIYADATIRQQHQYDMLNALEAKHNQHNMSQMLLELEDACRQAYINSESIRRQQHQYDMLNALEAKHNQHNMSKMLLELEDACRKALTNLEIAQCIYRDAYNQVNLQESQIRELCKDMELQEFDLITQMRLSELELICRYNDILSKTKSEYTVFQTQHEELQKLFEDMQQKHQQDEQNRLQALTPINKCANEALTKVSATINEISQNPNTDIDFIASFLNTGNTIAQTIDQAMAQIGATSDRQKETLENTTKYMSRTYEILRTVIAIHTSMIAYMQLAQMQTNERHEATITNKDIHLNALEDALEQTNDQIIELHDQKDAIEAQAAKQYEELRATLETQITGLITNYNKEQGKYSTAAQNAKEPLVRGNNAGRSNLLKDTILPQLRNLLLYLAPAKNTKSAHTSRRVSTNNSFDSFERAIQSVVSTKLANHSRRGSIIEHATHGSDSHTSTVERHIHTSDMPGTTESLPKNPVLSARSSRPPSRSSSTVSLRDEHDILLVSTPKAPTYISEQQEEEEKISATVSVPTYISEQPEEEEKISATVSVPTYISEQPEEEEKMPTTVSHRSTPSSKPLAPLSPMHVNQLGSMPSHTKSSSDAQSHNASHVSVGKEN